MMSEMAWEEVASKTVRGIPDALRVARSRSERADPRRNCAAVNA